MAALYAIWKRLRHVLLDGVNYDIGVKEREDGRFSVAWVCLACCEQGPPAPAAETFERAIAFAYVGLRAHHGLMHGDTRRKLAIKELLESCDVVDRDDFAASDRRHAAYERLKAAFAELCGPPANVRGCSADAEANCSKSADNSMTSEPRDWSKIAFDFDEALEEYSIEVAKQTKELAAKRIRVES